MRVQKIPPEAKAVALFPDAEFADAYRLIVDEPRLDALAAARRVLGRAPSWITMLMHMRNWLAARIGLKRAAHGSHEDSFRVGSFPIVGTNPQYIVLGLDDKHLDFRIVVETNTIEAQASEVTVTTLVRPHNLLGRAYLAFALPFHRTIVPAMPAQAART